MPSRAVLVVQHEDSCPLGWYDGWLADAGLQVQVCRGDRGDPLPADLSGFAGLIVLGGEMSATEDARYPWFAPTKALIREAIAAERPFLGICLGLQLAALATGGAVEPNPRGPAGGLTPVTLTWEGQADPLLGPVPSGTPAIQWNNDVVCTLPAGATELATAPDGTPQALRLGRRAWGVQFHPEASPAIFRSWTVDKPQARRYRSDGTDVVAAAGAIDAAEPALRCAWKPLATRFAGAVRRYGAQAPATVSRQPLPATSTG